MWEPITPAAAIVCALAWLGLIALGFYSCFKLAQSERAGTVVDRKEVARIVALRHAIELFTDEDRTGWYAEIPALDGCLAFAETPEKALWILEDIKRCWVEIALERGRTIPEPVGEEARD